MLKIKISKYGWFTLVGFVNKIKLNKKDYSNQLIRFTYIIIYNENPYIYKIYRGNLNDYIHYISDVKKHYNHIIKCKNYLIKTNP